MQTNSRPAHRTRRLLFLIGGIVIILLPILYFTAGYFVYAQLADVRGSCDKHLPNLPDHYENRTEWPDLDYSAYFMPAYEDVRFPSREPDLEIAGWYVEADPAAPAIIVVDGLGGCRHALAALASAGILWHNGFNVLIIDLRDTGESSPENGFSAVGNEEYRDVLGAWDWLVTERGFAPSRVGILGNSLGAAAVLLAADFEPQVAAIALNSPFSNLPQIIREELGRSGYPPWLAPSTVIMARLFKGENIVEYSPLETVTHLTGRPLLVIHSADDPRIAIHHSYQLEEAATGAQVDATFWYIDGAAHVRAPVIYPDEFGTEVGGFFHRYLDE